jgi:predicted transcriptional regulator
MAPQTDRSDVIISIHPGPAEQIANGRKTHEFRNYKLPPQVSRIWIYVTAPVSELRYMATVGPAQEPGQIPSNNAETEAFNAGRGSQFAHELLQVYQLNNPVPLAMIKERGFMKAPPQKYQYIPPAIVGELLGNLRCALFDSQHMELPYELPDDDHHEPEHVFHQDVTESQEIEEQLRSDIILATSQAQPAAAVEHEDENTSSSRNHAFPVVQTSPATVPRPDEVFARPQVPASHMQRNPATQRFRLGVDYNTVRPSQATTASEPSSPVVSPEKSMTLHRPSLASSGPSFPDFVGETQFSPLRRTQQQSFDLGSSQAIRLPDSLLVDDVRPPPVIWVSEDEDDD